MAKKKAVPKNKTKKAKKRGAPGKETRAQTAGTKKAPSLFENVRRVRMKVVGVGGGGGNIVSEVSSKTHRFEFAAANTDNQALKELPKKVKAFPFGQELTGGLGCGMDEALGERCAKAEKEKIKRLLEGADVCVLVAALGGGTGSGAAAVFAEVSQELRNLTLGIFTMPFGFEGERREQIAEAALEKIKPFVNAYIVIPNENIFRIIEQKTPLKEALGAVNKRLAGILQGFMDTVALPGLINIDFADVRSILEGKGRLAYIASVEVSGPAKAQQAQDAVLANPLYAYGLDGADRMLFNITSDRNLKMQEAARISSAISQHNPKARVIFGITCAARNRDRLRVTLFAVGCEQRRQVEHPVKTAEKKKPRARKLPRREKKQNQAAPPRAKQKQEVVAETPVAPAAENPVRRNALEVRQAVDEELKEVERQEKKWDVPAFLRNRS